MSLMGIIYGLLDTSNPKQLLNMVLFGVGKGFALCAGKELRALWAMPFNSLLKILCNEENEFFLRYIERHSFEDKQGGFETQESGHKIC